MQQVSDSDGTTNSTPESAIDNSLDTSSIEVIQPHEGLEIKLPISLPQRALPNSPESPRTNVAVPVSDDLLTEDEGTKTKLANEDPVSQAETKIEVSQTPNEHAVDTGNSEDPYPWLDSDDPRRKMTDEEILCLKVPFDKSILSAAEKEHLLKLMLENTAAFSIRDEIGTCPYFEVKLKLRDDKPFFVRPYNIREDQKPIIQK